MRIVVVLLLFFNGFSVVRAVNGKDSSTNYKPVHLLPVPTFGYSPETRSYFGAVVLGTMDFYRDSTRVSNAKAEVNYTWNKQLILEGEWNYFTRAEKWYTDGLVHYSKYPDRYYGIGANTADSSELLFESRRSRIEISALRSIRRNWFAGPNVRWINYGNISAEESIPFSELKDAAMYAVGIDLYHDSRINLLNPKNGTYLRSKILYCNGPDGGYPQLVVDARAYLQLPAKAILANRMLHRFNGSAVPYFDMSVSGGDDFVRGYFYGRFRDQNLSTFQTESRIPLFWRLGLTVFGGYSYIFRESINEAFAGKWNAGGGIRILMDKEQDVNLRLDYAVGQNGQNGFYIAFGESF